MVSFLRINQDVFTWKHEDMPGIDRKIIQHRLNVNLECKLVQQKQRIFALERNRVVTKEVDLTPHKNILSFTLFYGKR